jgi:hypothetical protein
MIMSSTQSSAVNGCLLLVPDRLPYSCRVSGTEQYVGDLSRIVAAWLIKRRMRRS